MIPRILSTAQKAKITLEANEAIKSAPIWHSSVPALLGLNVSADGMSCEVTPSPVPLMSAGPVAVNISVRCNVDTGSGIREVSKFYPFEVMVPEAEAIAEKIAVTAKA